VLEYRLVKNKLVYRYTNCVNGFHMPVKITADHDIVLNPTTEWQTLPLVTRVKSIVVNRNVYVQLKKVK